jgi:ribose 5-phosphate isomerase A
VTADDQKKAAGEAAAALVEPGMVVGLGTGSTAAHFVTALGARGLDIRGVPTSEATAEIARQAGIRLLSLDEAEQIDLTVDGADEIGQGLVLIKGGGGALLREKLVWEASRRCIVIADAAKQVVRLGKYPLPIEVVAFGHSTIQARICDALVECEINVAPRLRMQDGQPFRTDSGNLIYDVACGDIPDPGMLGDCLKVITGVVEHGLFIGLADEALVGTDGGVEHVKL